MPINPLHQQIVDDVKLVKQALRSNNLQLKLKTIDLILKSRTLARVERWYQGGQYYKGLHDERTEILQLIKATPLNEMGLQRQEKIAKVAPELFAVVLFYWLKNHPYKLLAEEAPILSNRALRHTSQAGRKSLMLQNLKKLRMLERQYNFPIRG